MISTASNTIPNQYIETVKTEISNFFNKELEMNPYILDIQFDNSFSNKIKIIIDVRYNSILCTNIQYEVDMNDCENVKWIHMLGKYCNKTNIITTEESIESQDPDKTLIDEYNEDNEDEFEYELEDKGSHSIIYNDEKLPSIHEALQEANLEIVKDLNLYLIRKHLLLRNGVMVKTCFYSK